MISGTLCEFVTLFVLAYVFHTSIPFQAFFTNVEVDDGLKKKDNREALWSLRSFSITAELFLHGQDLLYYKTL